jgi:hypothetical protein
MRASADSPDSANAFYAWVTKPLVEAKGTTLRFHEAGTVRLLDLSAVSENIDRVKVWGTTCCPTSSYLCEAARRRSGRPGAWRNESGLRAAVGNTEAVS